MRKELEKEIWYIMINSSVSYEKDKVKDRVRSCILNVGR